MCDVKKLGVSVCVVLVLLSSGCGDGGGPSDQDRQRAEDFCASEGQFDWGRGMSIDRYENPEGFDRCVDDAVKVVDCLDTPAKSGGDAWVPRNCDNDGYN